jgi:hypothetical protein
MSKLFGKFLKNTSVFALVAAPAMVFAAPPTGPISTFGIRGADNDFKLEGGSQRDKDNMPEVGLFYSSPLSPALSTRRALPPSTAKRATTSSRMARPTLTSAGVPRWMRATRSM